MKRKRIRPVLRKLVIREFEKQRHHVPELGEPRVLANWYQPEDGPGPMIDMAAYGRFLKLAPDHVVENLEKARLAQDGRIPMLKAGLGYVECLASTIVDGSALASSSTKTLLVPAILLPANYLQPGGIPGRTLRVVGSGRITTLTTAATLILGVGHATTNVVYSTTWAESGAMVMDTTVQTNTQWRLEAGGPVRSVGSAGTVFWTGEASVAPHSAFTAANAALRYMGSAGSAAPSTATVDMTVANYFSLGGKWSLTTAYSIQCHRFVLEALN